MQGKSEGGDLSTNKLIKERAPHFRKDSQLVDMLMINDKSVKSEANMYLCGFLSTTMKQTNELLYTLYLKFDAAIYPCNRAANKSLNAFGGASHMHQSCKI